MVLWTEQSAHGVEEEIREKAIPLDQDPGGESEPNRRNDRCSSKKFLHREKDKDFVVRVQRGETVTLLSLSRSWPLVNSPKAATGQAADANKDLRARERSI